MSYILHIDTSGSEGSIAIACNGAILAIETTNDSRNQAAAINNMITAALSTAAIVPGQLDAIAVCGGPGSYTGLRIGMATAKGLCYALDIPLLADNKLALLLGSKQQQYQDKYSQYTTLLVAREKEYFIAATDAGANFTIPSQHILEKDINKLVNNSYLITNADEAQLANILAEGAIIDHDISIDFPYWATLAQNEFNEGKFVNMATAAPFYLKEVYTHK